MKNSTFLLLSLFATTFLFSSCQNDDEADTNFNCMAFEWEYEGTSAPDHWGNCFMDCSGQSQSPIDITGAVVDGSLTALATQYEEVPIELKNNGHTVEFEYEEGSTLQLNGADYKLLQFHFHTQSEHTLDGMHYPMEVHLVHQNEATGNLAVIGILFEEGNENEFLANFSNDLPLSADDNYASESQINVEDLLPTNGAYYTYGGSLTTPPCSEIVTWLVFKTPVEASIAQIQSMHDIVHDNYRPVQALNGREIRAFN